MPDIYTTGKGCAVVIAVSILIGMIIRGGCDDSIDRNRGTPRSIENEDIAESVPAPVNPYDTELQNFLSSWESAWETKDLPYLMSMYSHRYQGRGQSYQSLQGYFNNVFSHSSSIDLSLHDFRVLSFSDSNASLRFLQVMTIDGASDRGVVTMHLEKVYGGWLITSEEWRPL